MFFPQTAEYALRAMAALANNDGGKPMRSRDIAERTGVPTHYLSKILRQLVTAGLLTSQKGHHGGFRVVAPLRTVRFLDVLTAVGYRNTAGRCAFGWGTCGDHDPCPLHESWSRLHDEFLDWAATTTLNDVQVPDEVATRLGLR